MDSPCGKRGKTLEKRTPEEEMEYRRYLRKRIRMRKRRRQVMIARTIVAVVGLVFVFLIFYGIGKLTDPLFAGKSRLFLCNFRATVAPGSRRERFHLFRKGMKMYMINYMP